MRITYITNEYGRASDTFIRGEVAALRELGLTVDTYSPRRPAASELISDEVRAAQATTRYLLDPDQLQRNVLSMFFEVLKSCAVSQRRLASTLRLALATSTPGVRAHVWQAAYLLEAALLVKLMRERDSQLLHDHMGSASAYVAMLASELSGIPFSLTVHGSHIFYEPRRWALGEKIARARFTACISDFCKSQCMIFTPYPHWHKLHVVRCGLDARFLEPEPPPLPAAMHLITVSRLTEEKGFPLLFEALAELRTRGLTPRLTVVGDGPLHGELCALRGRLGLVGQIELVGYKSSDEVRELIGQAKAFVLSSYAEGIPVVLMEALALGRPVVTTNVGGIPELVQAGESGWLVSPGSASALSVALEQLLTTPDGRLAHMGACGRARVRQNHDVRREAQKLARLFEQTGATAPR